MNPNDNSIKLIVNIVYEEFLNNFLNGDTKSLKLFSLINWNALIEGNFLILDSITLFNVIFKNILEIQQGNSDSRTIYKCLVLFILNLFIKFHDTGDNDFILEIQKLLNNDKLVENIPLTMIYEFKSILLKMVSLYSTKMRISILISCIKMR